MEDRRESSQSSAASQYEDCSSLPRHVQSRDAVSSPSERARTLGSASTQDTANARSLYAQEKCTRSLQSLWGQIKPQQNTSARVSGIQAYTGSPLGCPVLQASADVRSRCDFSPVVGFQSFGSAFGGTVSFGEAPRDSSLRLGGTRRFGHPAHRGNGTPVQNTAGSSGSLGCSLAFDEASGRERFSPFNQNTVPTGPDGQTVEGWGARGWGGDSAGVKKTSGDAASSKLSASLLGYFPDEFLKHFVMKPTRMQPLINRGYYSRVEAIRRLIVSFLEDSERLAASRDSPSTQPLAALRQLSAGSATPPLEKRATLDSGPVAQVVNIGAGADTTAFFLTRWGRATVFDVDFLDVCREKAAVIQRVPQLRECLGETCESPVDDPCVLRTTNYRLVAVDIRNVAALKVAMKSAGLEENIPTLFLCECVLIYLHVEEADAVLQWASEAVPLAPSALVIYEQFNPNDPFGRVMARNLQTRNCPLLTITKYPTLESQRKRFAEHGWPECSLADMRSVYENFLPKSERDRVQVLEIFDELEEWWLIQSHYFLGVFVRPGPPQAGGVTLASLVDVLGKRPNDTAR